MSPLSVMHGDAGNSGSGGSTPLQVAPPAPSMFPISPNPACASNGSKFSLQALANIVQLANAETHSVRLTQQEPAEPSESGTIASLRKIKARKQAIARSELDASKKRVGSVLASQLLRAANPDKASADTAGKNEDGPSSNQGAKLIALQIEVTNLKNERETMLSRITQLERFKDLSTEVQTWPGRLQQLETVSERRKQLEALPDRVTELQNTLDGLHKWKQSHSNPLTPEQLQNSITALKTELQTQIKEFAKKSIPAASVLGDVKDLGKQLDDLSHSIRDVASKETSTYDKIKERIEPEAEKLKKRVDDIDWDLEKLIGPLYSEHKRTGLTVLERLTTLSTSVGDLAQQMKQIETSMQQVSKNNDNLGTRLSQVESRLSEAEPLAAMVEELNANVGKDGVHDKKLIEFDGRLQRIQALIPEINRITEKTGEKSQLGDLVYASDPDLKNQFGDMVQDMNAIGDDLERLERKLFQLEGTVQTVQTEIPELFMSEIDPIKLGARQDRQRMQEQVDALKRQSIEHRSRVNTPQPALTAAERQQLVHLAAESKTFQEASADIQKWRGGADNKLLELDVLITGLGQQMEAKTQSIQASERQIEILQNVLRSLEDRYQNITTEALYQHMVHWIADAYPNAPGFLNQLGAVQADITSLRKFNNEIRWVSQVAQQLYGLAQSSQQLQQLAQNAESVHSLPQTLQKVDDTCELARQAVAKSYDATSLATQTENSLREINATLSALQETANQFSVLQVTQNELSKRLDTEQTARVEGDMTLDHNISAEKEERIHSIADISDSMISYNRDTQSLNDRYNRIENETKLCKNQISRIETLVQPVKDLDVGQIQHFAAAFPQILQSIYQIQTIVEAVNKNLQGGGLKFNWNVDFEKLINGNDKGKKKG